MWCLVWYLVWYLVWLKLAIWNDEVVTKRSTRKMKWHFWISSLLCNTSWITEYSHCESVNWNKVNDWRAREEERKLFYLHFVISCWINVHLAFASLKIEHVTFPVKYYTLHVTRYTLHVTCYRLHVTCYTLHVTFSVIIWHTRALFKFVSATF